MIWSSKSKAAVDGVLPEDPLGPLPIEVIFKPSPSVVKAMHRRSKSDCSLRYHSSLLPSSPLRLAKHLTPTLNESHECTLT
jgi:hypothetical protein